MSAGNPDQKVYVYAVFSSTKMFMFLGFRTQHINIRPLATRSRQTLGKIVYVYVPFLSRTFRP